MSNSELAGRLTRTARWRWMAGMRLLDGDLVIAVSGDGLPIAASPAVLFGVPPMARKDALPDLTDPATLGCLLALVREAHGAPMLSAYYSTALSGWIVAGQSTEGGWCRPCGFSHASPTEAAALVAALEAAP